MIEIIEWGRTEYAAALEQQKARLQARCAGEVADALIFTEHEPVFTTGLRKDAARHLLWKNDELRERGIAFHASNRGGDITYHGPGQIVGYPILSLDHHRDLHAYLRDLESVIIATLAHYGLEAERREGKTGIWIEQRKICALGVAVKKWVTYHGFALNLDPDLSHFEGIVPCGITDGTVTSLKAELSQPPTASGLKTRLAVEFNSVFGNTPALS
ncbi:MAG: lipoyl(octanoyl) transferase LipB [Verrucomicrobia bacterium]|nr:lipoyl(octanoyl) transferase LipB [Verrucomicrobiota bacterium]